MVCTTMPTVNVIAGQYIAHNYTSQYLTFTTNVTCAIFSAILERVLFCLMTEPCQQV